MSSINALIVDDSSTSRTILAKVLKKMDIHCEQAKSGEEALSLLHNYQPDFIFLDHIMPGLDGFETLKAIKTKPETEGIPVIMYTSQHAHRYYEEAQELGAAGVISKQIDRDKLYMMINSLCMQAEIESEAEAANENSAPSVYEEVTRNLEKAFNEDEQAKLLARIAQMETAYQELVEEQKTLKAELALISSKLQLSVEKSKKLSFPQFIVTFFIAIALFFSSYAWLAISEIKNTQIISGTKQAQNAELIDEIIKVLERQSNDNRGNSPGQSKSSSNLP